MKADKSNHEILKLNFSDNAEITIRCGAIEIDKNNMLDDFTQLGIFVRMQISKIVKNLKAYNKTKVINISLGDILYNGQGFDYTSNGNEKYIQMGMIRVGKKVFEIHLECLSSGKNKSATKMYKFIEENISE